MATFISKGTQFKNNWNILAAQRVASVGGFIPSAKRLYKDLSWWNDTIRLYLTRFGFSVWLNFNADGTFTSWYRNLEAPFVRTEIGIDTRAFALDIVGSPDRKLEWKDKVEFERRLEAGVDSAEHQANVLASAGEFIRRFVQNNWPFNTRGPSSSKAPFDRETHPYRNVWIPRQPTPETNSL